MKAFSQDQFFQTLTTIAEDPELSSSTDCESYLSGSEPDSPVHAASEALLFFDWDDTILPTTWLLTQGLITDQGLPENNEIFLSREQQTLLQELEAFAEQTLLSAMKHGRLVIVTNAADGWVESSCSAFMPGLLPLLDDLDIISARSCYEDAGGDSPTEWKRLAFVDVIDAAFEGLAPCSRRNILSIGDSVHEQLALSAATRGIAFCHAKSVKLMDRPPIERLIEEHRLLDEQIDVVVAQEDSIDLEVGTGTGAA
eukprot:TRINITY_DN20984_c0_g1_i1.p1 TRINITY_DN20984_c0_g1~~TRINITY_DN20984_c0_g1_i1.p1  ORF type:complete len:255 (-),score=66.73 TRINITY_DN20984_c0_g1_i1:200-964(-)